MVPWLLREGRTVATGPKRPTGGGAAPAGLAKAPQASDVSWRLPASKESPCSAAPARRLLLYLLIFLSGGFCAVIDAAGPRGRWPPPSARPAGGAPGRRLGRPASGAPGRRLGRQRPVPVQGVSSAAAREEEVVSSSAFVHLHNVAGTFMCQQAQKQGECTPPNSPVGCMVEKCSARPENRMSCSQRQQLAWTFTQMERDVSSEDIDACDGLLHGVVLRDPVKQAMSTLSKNKFDRDSLMNVLRSGRVEEVKHAPCLPRWDTYQHFDNFATRSLGDAYMVGPLGVTREHLEIAKQRLRKMAVILILEEMNSHAVQLVHALGWDLQTILSSSASGKSRKSKDRAFTEDDLDVIRRVNAIDYELLSFGRELADNLTRAANAARQGVPRLLREASPPLAKSSWRTGGDDVDVDVDVDAALLGDLSESTCDEDVEGPVLAIPAPRGRGGGDGRSAV
ncbi:unnamed protein product [Prorocentrum cordatum]|uniref:Uncharacterized protein n=1 Tax=Prorocentrum cordatum TaxID=2364126 RepID=A0ABN9V052_9DINO|nr:unnamed protein product [Polarella glacialis]